MNRQTWAEIFRKLLVTVVMLIGAFYLSGCGEYDASSLSGDDYDSGIAAESNEIEIDRSAQIDTTLPQVIRTDPADGDEEVEADTKIHIYFSKVMDGPTVEQSISITPEITKGVYYFWESNTLNLYTHLEGGVTYTVEISTDAKDLNGNGLVEAYSFSFSTLHGSQQLLVSDEGNNDDDDCFIATAAYGVDNFRLSAFYKFRNEFLLGSEAGQYFTRCYYQLSPYVAKIISENSLLKSLTRSLIAPIAAVSTNFKLALVVLIMLMLSPVYVLARKSSK